MRVWMRSDMACVVGQKLLYVRPLLKAEIVICRSPSFTFLSPFALLSSCVLSVTQFVILLLE